MTATDVRPPAVVRFFASTPVDVTVKLFAVVSLVLAVGVGAKQYQLADCLANYNDDAAKSSQPRLKAAEDDRQALDTLFFRIVEAKSRGDSAAAFKDYVARRHQANETRKKNPPPPPPSEVCR